MLFLPTSSKELEQFTWYQLLELYAWLNRDAKDEWYPIMVVTDECPYCHGEAHPFENLRQEYMESRCFNNSCTHYGKAVDQWYKKEDYYRMSIEMALKF